MKRSFLFIIAIACWLAVLLTNRYYSFDDPWTRKAALDSTIYKAIADAAPGLPSPEEKLIFHGAQRFYLPYTLGCIAKVLQVDSFVVFQWTVALLFLATGLLFAAILQRAQVPTYLGPILLSILLFHPYLFRLQLALAGFINDAFFVFGFTLLIFFLLRQKLFPQLIALTFMIVGKQTAVPVLALLLPMVLFTNLFGSKYSMRQRGWFAFLSVAIVVTIVGTSSWIVYPFSAKPQVGGGLDIFRWIFFGFDFAAGAEFMAKMLLALLIPLAFWISFRPRRGLSENSKLSLTLAGLTVAALIQPILSGPYIVGGSVQRLSALCLPAFLSWVALRAQGLNLGLSTMRCALAVLLIFLASLHHLFSICDWSLLHLPMLANQRFAVMHCLLGFLALMIFLTGVSTKFVNKVTSA